VSPAGSSEHDKGGEGGLVLTAAAIAEAGGGELRGDPEVRVVRVAPLDRATDDDLSFLAGPKYAAAFAASAAGVVLVTPELADAPGTVRTRIIVPRPHEAMLRLLPRFSRDSHPEPGIHPTAVLGKGVVLGDGVAIGPYAVIGRGVRLGDGAAIGSHCTIGDGVQVGDRSRLYPGVTLYAGTTLGARVLVHAGARLGSDGFGYVQMNGAHVKIPHVGRCVIEDDVEIGANTTIDRGSIDDTVVGAGTKIDNLVHIAHNVRIGRGCLIMAQVGIAGSVHVEDGCILAGQVGVSGHHTIGRGATLAAQAGVFGDIPAGQVWSGYPARPHKEALRAQAALFKMPALQRRIERLLDREDAATGSSR
jgi:UDP-3-O-[3-hydroxymyristoyl] glucosamine N-acyltransferase